ncbi:acyltransferase [Alcanivorax sp.]|uniref:acyltransferase family protein n=1 Tax=Alcanivorax sp. TaxID=1872427 RepID=UPI0025BFBC6F|nr:acyltransferase [Alcanivorax sp.]
MKRISSIDGWRFVAVFMVLLGHYLYRIDAQGVLSIFVTMGRLGVEIFFVISGYVITLGMIKEKEKNSTISFKAFYLCRAFRILPPLFVYIFTLCLLGLAGLIDFNYIEAFFAIFFVTNLHDLVSVGWYLDHTWSLSYEEQFYLLFPLIIAFNGIGVRGVLAFIVFAFVFYLFDYDMLGGVFRYFSFLLAGVALSLKEKELGSFFDDFGGGLRAGLLTFCMALVLALHLIDGFFIEILEIAVQPFGIALMLFLSVRFSSFLSPVLNNPLFVYLGSVSYGIYLWQQLALGPHELGAIEYLFGLLAILLLSVLQYEFFEKALIKKGRDLSDRV